MVTPPPIKPILKYPGAKWRIAPWIVEHFPPHAHYIEPFFGSGAVFFTKPPAHHEVINDVSRDVVNLFRVLRERSTELAALIEMTPWARVEYDVCAERTGDALEDARRFVVRISQGFGGAGHLRSGWKHNGLAPSHARTTSLWRQLPQRLLAVAERLQYAEIECSPAVELLSRYNGPDVLVYVDPPYPLSTRNNNVMYQHELTDADHVALLDVLDAHSGPVVLSGYHCPLYDDRLAQWSFVEKVTRAEQGSVRTEVLWLNAQAQPAQQNIFATLEVTL